ncbi:hypothetical protein SCLCIDRAFT_490137 [Scleroderma citrinum Foug A]|uniref:Uncharacterized protein n=1 Tax=Scleroderma citrinum Foug A TaxID=1036808 RepID=A0A0C3EPW6_9AGAM|nr:hypothetical protein SCLCIDRAFT_490137 [Scleroderma citrinum Foug A]
MEDNRSLSTVTNANDDHRHSPCFLGPSAKFTNVLVRYRWHRVDRIALLQPRSNDLITTFCGLIGWPSRFLSRNIQPWRTPSLPELFTTSVQWNPLPPSVDSVPMLPSPALIDSRRRLFPTRREQSPHYRCLL